MKISWGRFILKVKKKKKRKLRGARSLLVVIYQKMVQPPRKGTYYNSVYDTTSMLKSRE